MKKQTLLKSTLCLFMALVCNVAMQAKVEHLLPKVHTLNETNGTPFALQRPVTITDVNNTAALKKVFTDYGCTIGEGGATVTVQMVSEITGAYDYTLEGYDNEGYQLIVTENAITIKAVKPIGVIRAAQTLAQLAEGYDENAAAIETVEITDWAAFKLRGYMHDVGRSFISVEELKKQIDLLSRFKVNTFHWHFTENQAWRFEVEGYSQLTDASSMTRFEGQYYTQAQCREVAAYAHERGVTIIPEIDMPGHSQAFKTAMGFSMQTDRGVEVLKTVLTQLADVFPHSPYIHIGADEEEIEYPNFLGIMADHIHGLGRKMVVWNPIRGVSINSTMCDMTQMWSSSGKNITGVPDIDCRYNYTNHFDVFADVVGIYKSNIYYADKGSEEIAGTISAYWNDRKMPTEADIVKQNNLYANVIASAERAWYGSKVNGAEGYIEKLGTTLPNSGEVYEEFKDWEERFLFHKAHSLKGQPIPYVKQTNVRWRITDPFPNGGNLTTAFAPDAYAATTIAADGGLIPENFTHEGQTYYTGMATGAGIYLRHTWGNNIIPTYYGSTNYPNCTAYAWTYVYSETEQQVGAQIEFQNYGRSEQDGAAPAGKWDHYGSQIWINGVEVAAPSYKNTGKGINKEVDLLDENFTGREPIAVTLNAGWNKVFIKLPYSGGSYRLPKWMFTCVFTTLDGVDAVEGLIYSPNQCKDEATEAVAAKISELKRDRGNLIGTAIGSWDASLATALDAKIAAIEATYSVDKTDEERAAQVAELEAAWTTFAASLTTENMNKPVSGNYYRMYTPLRDSRYVTGNGAGNAATGETTATTKASIWKFVTRNDGSYDIINLVDGTYISPASGNNSALNCVAEQPTAGWNVKQAATNGKVLITSTSASNNVQFNQTGSGQSYKLYNWGYNSTGFSNAFNTTDTGCQFELIDVTASIPPQPLVTLTGLGRETYPYQLSDADEASVLGVENLTIALDVVMGSSMGNSEAFVSASDVSVTSDNSTYDNTSTFVAVGQQAGKIRYFASAKSNGWYTANTAQLTASQSHKVVIVIDKVSGTRKTYVDGTAASITNFQDFHHFKDNANANVYIGGAKNSAGNKYVFSGQVRSAQFFEGALSADKIAMIEYPVNEDDVILSNAAAANSAMNIFGLQRYLGLVQDAGTGLTGDGQLVCNFPANTSQESGNAYANLIDGNYTTFFHSGYNNTNGQTLGDAPHYLQVDLGKAVKSFRFYFKKRSQNNNNRPAKITIEGSNDKEAWAEVKVISSGFPTDANVLDYYSEEITSTTAYQHYRFTVNSTNTNSVFFSLSEFYILPSEYTKVKETFDAVRAYRAEATVETAAALNAVYAWNKGLSEGSPIVGVESNIYADTYKDGKFLNRYLYNNNGSLALTTELQRSNAAYIWIPAVTDDGKYNFKNKASKYLAHKGMSDNAHNFTVAATTRHMGVTLHTQGSNYFVIKNADGGFDQSSTTYDQTSTNYCTDFVFIPTDLYEQTFEPVELTSYEEFENGGIYTFVTTRGWVGANDGDVAIGTVKTTVNPAASNNNAMFQWAVYKSAKGNYYLYNVGKGKYMGVPSQDKGSIPLTEAPMGKNLTFKIIEGETNYPFMFSTDNIHAVTQNAASGLFGWKDGWNKTDDAGSNHKVTLVGMLTTAELKSIADLVDEAEADQVQLYVKAEVEGLEESNPNTHFGTLRATSKFGTNTTKLKRNPGVATIDYLETPTTVIDFTRAYRGFEFQGFFLGEENLGKSFTPDENLKTRVSAENPLIAKFTATEDVTLFYDDDDFSYRIPAIGKTSTGRLIAVSDYRYSLDDIGRYNYGTANPGIDLVIRTSDDNGKTWGPKQTIAAGSRVRGTDDCAYGDAAIAVVGQKVLVMAAAGDVMFGNGSATAHNRAVRVFSEDNGVTWTKQDISETLFLGADATIQNGYTAFFGSGRLAVDANYNGTGKARIYGALLLKKASGTGNYVIYTDDLGLTWSILGGSQDAVASQDEPKVEILPSGQILLSVRRGGGRQFNVFTYTDKATNAGSWDSNVNGCGNGGSNTCNGEPYLVDAEKADGTRVKLLLQSQPKGGSGLYDRRDVTIWYKEVDNTNYTSAQIAADWTQGLQVSTQQSAYSAMALQNDGKIAFFFEEAPCYGDDQAKGYCMVYAPLTIEAITKDNYKTPEVKEEEGEEDDEVTSADALPGDGILRFYRLAIPVTASAYTEDLESNGDKVKAFWQECEEFVNKMFVPLGFCFEVVVDDKLINVTDLTIGGSGLPEIGNCTYDLNNIIGEANYDVAMWVTHRDEFEENSGLSALKGAYSSNTKGSGYAKTDKWVVAHELGHMFGAVHTLQGEGSLMDNQGEYFSYPSIKAIRNSAVGASSYNNVKVANNAPQFDAEKMQQTYRIPQGACLAIDVQATDKEGHKLMYTAIGCNSANVDNVQEGKDVTLPFASFAPQESNVISYSPVYTADVVDENFFLFKEGTGIHEMKAGVYPLSILVNDAPSTAWSYAALIAEPFYSTYAIWETLVQVVGGTAFNACLDTDKTDFEANEQVVLKWGVNKNYFTENSRLRITMSDDYGKTFDYVLAESVKATEGSCTVTLPNVNVGQVAVDFTTATRTMNGGVIKIEEIGGAAYTTTALDPSTDKGFSITGGVNIIKSSIGEHKIGTFYANEPMTVPEGLTAYVATQAPTMNGERGTITMTAITDGIIPAQTGVVIRGEKGVYKFRTSETQGTTDICNNLMRGYAGSNEYEEVALPTNNTTNYVLTVQNGEAGFYRKAAGFKVYKNKAYLNVPGDAKALGIRFVGEGTTSIEETTDNNQQTTVIYDLTGRRVLSPTKGMYIVNGRKVIF